MISIKQNFNNIVSAKQEAKTNNITMSVAPSTC